MYEIRHGSHRFLFQVLKVALEESEREVKKIPLMISYSEKRISLLEDILAEYKHEAMVNNNGGTRGGSGGSETHHPPTDSSHDVKKDLQSFQKEQSQENVRSGCEVDDVSSIDYDML